MDAEEKRVVQDFIRSANMARRRGYDDYSIGDVFGGYGGGGYGGDTIGDLIGRGGDIAAQRALSSGSVWGQAIPSILGQIGSSVGGYFENKQKQKEAENRALKSAAWTQYVESGDWQDDPKKAYGVARTLWGEDADKHFGALESVKKLAGEKKAEDPLKNEEHLGRIAASLSDLSDADLGKMAPYLAPLVDKVHPGEGAKLPTDPGELRSMTKLYAQTYAPKEKTEGYTLKPGEQRYEGGKLVASLPAAPSDKAAATKDINGREMQWNPDTNRYDIDLGASASGTARSTAAATKAATEGEKKTAEEQEVSSWVDTLKQGGSLANVPAALKSKVNQAYQKETGYRALSTPAEAEKNVALDNLEQQINQIEQVGKDVISKYGATSGPLQGARNQLNKIAGSIVEGDLSIPTPVGSINPGEFLRGSTTDPVLTKLWSLGSGLGDIARAQGQKGNLSNKEQENVKVNLPKLGDTPEQLAAKIEQLRAIVSRGRQSLGRGKIDEDALIAKYGG